MIITSNTLIYRLYNIIRAVVNYTLVRPYVSFLSLKENKYFCISMAGNDFGDNIKCLADYIQSVESNSIVVWGFTDFYYNVNCSYPKVKLYSLKYYYHILTSKYVLVNQGINHKTLIKRKGQIVVQTWHGTALKKIGSDIKRKEEEKYIIDRWFRPDPEKYYVPLIDIWISGSRFMSKIYKEKFSYSKPIYEVGTPRNDIFFKNDNNVVKKVKALFGISDETGIVLYAPTFRSDRKLTHYNINSSLVLKSLSERFGKNYVFMIRLHPILIQLGDLFSEYFPAGTINASSYPNMQELLYASDVLITDYSSSIFDFMYSRKPIFMYLPDKYAYSNLRGLYFDIDLLPFIKISNNNEIVESVQHYNQQQYEKKLDEFLITIGSVESGNATRSTYEIMKERKSYNFYS